MPSEIGIKIDNRYETLEELGRGGMGVVYKATDLKMDRVVAIKVMTSHSVGRDEYLKRFLLEAKSIAKMQHPNIVVVYDYGYHAGAPYMAMEYVEGMPLDKAIRVLPNLSMLVKVDYIAQVCHALHYAHQCSLVHRDVKPGNIMVLEGSRRVKLLDFGIARAAGSSSLSKSGMAMGTIYYMSPEQTRGLRDLDRRADIFSAGVVLYELLAGTPPWNGPGDYDIMNKIINDPYPPLSTYLRNYPAGLDHVLECALAKDANARYQTAEKMAQELSDLEAPLKEQALEDALVQFEQGDLLRSNDLVSQILRIDTRHREAVELRNKLQHLGQLQQRSEQVRQLRTSAEHSVGQKRYADALAAIEQAISIDSGNSELFQYRDLIRHELRRREEVGKKLALAQRAQEINDLSSAQDLIDKALEVDPTDTQARTMKSQIEQEQKQQQLREICEDASRALAARAFQRVREIIRQLEELDPDCTLLPSLRKNLLEGEAEEKRNIEVEGLVRDIRQALKVSDVRQSLALTEQVVARFPGEPRLVRLRAQAEALRDAAEREQTIQEQVAAVGRLVESGSPGEALRTAEAAMKRLGTDHRLQAAINQARQKLEHERMAGLYQEVLARAQDAMRAGNYESAIKILTAARADFPVSAEMAEALRNAQEAMVRKAADDIADNARKREIADSLERALVNEPDPEAQVRLAEKTVRGLPGNEWAQQVLLRVRDRQQQIASIIQRAQRAEHARDYSGSVREWERVRQLCPQHPQPDTQIARLTAAQEAEHRTPETAPQISPARDLSASSMRDLSATSMMVGAPRTAPSRPAEPPSAPLVQPEATPEVAVAVLSESGGSSKKILLSVVGMVVFVIAASLLYLALRPQKTPRPPVVESHPETITTIPIVPRPNADTSSVPPAQQAATGKDRPASPQTTSPPAQSSAKPNNATTKPSESASIAGGAKEAPAPPPSSVSLTATSSSILEGQSTTLQWQTQNATDVRIEPGLGTVQPTDSKLVSPATSTTYILTAKGDRPLRETVTINVTPSPKPIISSFEAGTERILQGQTTKLIWEIKNASGGSIDQDIGSVGPQGSHPIKPSKTTKYTLTVQGPGGPYAQSTTVIVDVPAATAPQPVAATPPAEDPDIAAMQATVLRYRDAFRSMSIDEVRKVWPRISKELQKAVQESFHKKGVTAIQLDFKCEKYTYTGDSGQCICAETMAYTLDGKVQSPETHSFVFSFTKDKGSNKWVVEKHQAK